MNTRLCFSPFLHSKRVRHCFTAILVTSILGGGAYSWIAAPQQAVAQPATAEQLSIISASDLNLPAVAAVAEHPNGRRLYAGANGSRDPQRRNLSVVTLDANGKPGAQPRRYRDSTLPLLGVESNSSVGALLVNAAQRKLYLGAVIAAATPSTEKRTLAVYDLNEQGDPVGAPRQFDSGNPNNSVLGLALHPKLPLLYLVGWGGAGVYLHNLDAQGNPTGQPQEMPVGGQGKYQIAISPDAKKLYLGTYPDTVEVVDLDAEGKITGTPRPYKAGAEEKYLKFLHTPRALYLVRDTPQGTRLGIWKLDAQGEPQGSVQVRDDVAANALSYDATGNRLWVATPASFTDAFTGQSVVEGMKPVAFQIGPDGALTLEKTGALRRRQNAVAANVGAAGGSAFVTEELPPTLLGNYVKDYRLRVTLLEAKRADGTAFGALPIGVDINGVPRLLGEATPGSSTSWINLDEFLKDKRGQLAAYVYAGNRYATPDAPDYVANLKMRLEIAQGDPAAGGTTLATLTEAVQGNPLVVLLPGYGYEPPQTRVAAIETMSAHAQKYLAAARAVAVKPGDRPRLFPISCYHLMGAQGNMEQLKAGAETVASLGFNTANAYNWGGIAPREVDAILDKNGLEWRSLAAYEPPSYFTFPAAKMTPQALDAWVAPFVTTLANTNAATPGDVIDFKIADEPGWYYPARLREVNETPENLAVFHEYLRSQKLTPQFFGKNSWDEVRAVGASAAGDLPSRRLFYWTMRFFPESSARAHKAAAQAVRRAFPNARFADVNWNNWPSRWYRASPNELIANNTEAVPDAAVGSMDWFDSGRLSAHTLWSEDWVGDQSAQIWSYYGDLLRSAAMLGDQEFGSYVIGNTTGAHPEGTSYKTLALLAHGGKAIDMYTWGPGVIFGDGWSESLDKYRPVAQALGRVGRAERLLYPGKPARGKVAILVPGSATLWESKQHLPIYLPEIEGLHSALIHAGYTIDFVDEKELALTDWKQRGYTTLYITAPNIAGAAQTQIVDWVRAGGTLVATPGAGVADEYNTPTDTLNGVLGLKDRQAVRESAPALQAWATGVLMPGDPRFGKDEIRLVGALSPLSPGGANVMASFQAGGAAITASQFGQGRAIAYGFFPGQQYWQSPDRNDAAHLPLNWGAAQRALTVAPVTIAKTPREIELDHEVVEAARLTSDKGIAIVLLNWTDEPIANLTVTIPRTGKFKKVSSNEGTPLKSVAEGDGLKVTLPLKSVDVLMVE